MAASADYYAVLEVSPSASPEEIERAYRRLLRAWHPGNYPPDAPREVHALAEERTRLLIEAKQELSDPARRRAFDERRNGTAIVEEPTAAAAPEPDAARQAAPRTRRLVAWFAFTGLLAATSYALEAGDADVPTDFLFRWATSLGVVAQSALMLALVLWIAPAIRVRDTVRGVRPGGAARAVLGLRSPRSWRWALLAGGAILVGDYVLTLILDPVLGASEEQGLATGFWDGSRVPQFAASLLAIAVIVPVVEELTFRGIGFGLLERFGQTTAIVVTGVMFGLAHGFLLPLPLFVAFGLAMGWLRSRTGSVYPCILVHGVVNAVALVLGVAVGDAGA